MKLRVQQEVNIYQFEVDNIYCQLKEIMDYRKKSSKNIKLPFYRAAVWKIRNEILKFSCKITCLIVCTTIEVHPVRQSKYALSSCNVHLSISFVPNENKPLCHCQSRNVELYDVCVNRYSLKTLL